jgi:DNA polymerase III delta prime subunit
MDISQEARDHTELVANETLDLFEKIAETAKGKLREEPSMDSDVFASDNTWTSGGAGPKLRQIFQANAESYQILIDEPAIARIVFTDTDGHQKIYFICRATPLTEHKNLASYRSPLGRLAAIPVGKKFTLPNGITVEVMARAQLRPRMNAEGWDSRDTIVEAGNFGPITIESLRAFLTEITHEVPTEDLLGQLLAEEQRKVNITEGVRRSVILKMGLRDQPVLDQYQDEIFRLPLDERLLILGPPGTGKTTTLIRRLGQKVDTAFLDEDEQRIVESAGATNGVAHINSWMMFTPTMLLKFYLKEAFAREGVPASDRRIRTWSNYRRELARGTFGVLRTASGGGIFVLKDTISIVETEAIENPIAWFTDFYGWQRAAFTRELSQSAHFLRDFPDPKVAEIGRRLALILDRSDGEAKAATFVELVSEAIVVKTLVSSLKEATDSKIKGALNLQINRDKEFLDKLAVFIDEMQQVQDAEIDDQDEMESEEDEAAPIRTGRAAAMHAFMQTTRAQARAHAAKKTLNKSSRSGMIVGWLGERTLSEADIPEVGASLLIQSHARRFVNPVKRYIRNIPNRYRAFRRPRQEENKWYRNVDFASTDLQPLELDVVLLAILQGAGELLSKSNIVREIDEPVWSSLKEILALYRNQILVDEVTDFSPVQLACMAALTHPRIRSFFACGDFNQRLTLWGTRTVDDLKWVFPDIDIREITVSYRQSRQLNELARAIIREVSGSDHHVSLPEHVDNEGVAPALLETESENQKIVSWLAERIREIERFVRQLPSTAIFVNSEEEVGPVAEKLNAALSEHNIQVVACPQGQVIGQDNDVRVFDIQHIKGLEFEAVFFIAVDRLATLQPELFDKYLYVGTTRAAMYLGITCEGTLPDPISNLRHMFVSNWDAPCQLSTP